MMSGGTLVVAKEKKPGFKTTPVKLDTGLVRKAKTIAEDKGIDLSEYLTAIVRGQIERDWTKILKKIAEAESEESGD
jgi:hypothetical protein